MARINARLDHKLSQKLAELRKLTGKSTSEVLKTALELYHERAAQPRSPLQILEQHGFCASGEGEPDLSRDYKQLLTRSLERKL